MKKNVKYVEMTSPFLEVLGVASSAFILWYGGTQVLNGEISQGAFLAFIVALFMMYTPIRILFKIFTNVQTSLAGAERVFDILDLPEEKVLEGKKELRDFKGRIEFKDVSFRYNEEKEGPTLKSVNLKIEGEKMTALVGHSGAGKSTIMNLIPRFYDSNSGNILIDEKSIYKTKISSLRKNISLVSQDTTLFDDSIKNNIAYANRNANEEEIINAAKLSFADEFIDKLPNKYDTIIGENGIRLSGGEKQRLSIARAMLKDSKIILLDEATSSLDSETESKIQKAINFLIKGKTTLVIAHRLSTILNSQKIYVIDNGTIIDEGNHEELMKNSEIYKSFYDKQLRKD